MTELNKALILSKFNIISFFKSKGLWFSYFFCVLISIFNNWDDKRKSLVLLNIPVYWDNRTTAFKSLFYEVYNFWWILLIIVIIQKIMFPLKDSFTISNTLWLRFSYATPTTLAISRVFLVLFFVLFIIALSMIWLMLFLSKQNLDFNYIYLLPIWGLTGYILLSSSLLLLFDSNHLLNNNARIMIVLVSLFIPMGLFYFENKFTQIFDGFFPYSFPVGFDKVEIYTQRAYLTSIFIGIIFLLTHIIKKYFSS